MPQTAPVKKRHESSSTTDHAVPRPMAGRAHSGRHELFPSKFVWALPVKRLSFILKRQSAKFSGTHLRGLFVVRLSFALLLFGGVLWVRAKIQSSEPSTRTTCQICINFICYIIIYKCTLVKRCFINKVREEHVKIITRINTRGAQSVTKPVNKIIGVYIYTADLLLTASLRHPLSALTTIPVLTCKRWGWGGGILLVRAKIQSPVDTLPF